MRLVHPIGDSSLDTSFWTGNYRDSVEGQLQKKLGREYTVQSHAYDGFTTSSVLNGDFVGRVLQIGPDFQLTDRKKFYLKNRKITPPNYFVHPLKDLKKSVEENPDATHYVVLSVGGNDFRENLLRPHRLLPDIPAIHSRYFQIVEEIKALKARDIRPIIMLQYPVDLKDDRYGIYCIMRIIGVATTCFNSLGAALALTFPINAASGLAGCALLTLSNKVLPLRISKDIIKGKQIGLTTLSALMERFYAPILTKALAEKIPVLDLSNTFDPHKDLYTAQIEPNKKGSALIAEGIHHIITQHNFRGESKLYSKKEGESYKACENKPDSWRVRW